MGDKRLKFYPPKGGEPVIANPEYRDHYLSMGEILRDTEEKIYADAKLHRDAIDKIKELEDSITNRRLRDVLASDEGKTWVADVEKLIAVERAKL